MVTAKAQVRPWDPSPSKLGATSQALRCTPFFLPHIPPMRLSLMVAQGVEQLQKEWWRRGRVVPGLWCGGWRALRASQVQVLVVEGTGTESRVSTSKMREELFSRTGYITMPMYHSADTGEPAFSFTLWAPCLPWLEVKCSLSRAPRGCVLPQGPDSPVRSEPRDSCSSTSSPIKTSLPESSKDLYFNPAPEARLTATGCNLEPFPL